MPLAWATARLLWAIGGLLWAAAYAMATALFEQWGESRYDDPRACPLNERAHGICCHPASAQVILQLNPPATYLYHPAFAADPTVLSIESLAAA